jgi:hypothetical protein
VTTAQASRGVDLADLLILYAERAELRGIQVDGGDRHHLAQGANRLNDRRLDLFPLIPLEDRGVQAG